MNKRTGILVVLIFMSLGTAQTLITDQASVYVEPDELKRTLPYTARDFLEAVTAKDYGLEGPVASVTYREFRVDPESEPAWQPINIPLTAQSPRSSGIVGPRAVRLIFDEQGYLQEFQGLGPEGNVEERYHYIYEDGFYLGYENPQYSLKRVRVGDNKVVIFKRGLGPVYQRHLDMDIHLIYDDEGRLISEATYDPPLPFTYTRGRLDIEPTYSLEPAGPLRERTEYRYENGVLAEVIEYSPTRESPDRVVPVARKVYLYNPEDLLTWGQGLLIAVKRVDPTAPLDIGTINGEGRPPIYELITSGGSEYFYHPDGSLAEVWEYTNSFFRNGVPRKDIFYKRRFRDGRMVERLEYNANIISTRTLLEYDDVEQRELAWTWKYYTRKFIPTLTVYEIYGFDAYGNWTTRRSTGGTNISEAELRERLETYFRGRVLTRDITYH